MKICPFWKKTVLTYPTDFPNFLYYDTLNKEAWLRESSKLITILRSVHTVRQRLRQRCHYQLDSTVSNGLVHTGAAAAAVLQGAASKWVPTLFYAAVYVAAAVAKTLAAPLPYRVNEPLKVIKIHRNCQLITFESSQRDTFVRCNN